ncbi:type I-MYXAN CRISPR-associated Cas8a1/Cmx1 [Leptolyngbya sp. FACHB-671]|uniref:type I-MYXAN CRISPR-associated Cas8a1/Cmx1 n=1 Tax=Leptolyngbya sp. FACHB-671 TaxID=2692812 RepID=UPI0016870419|nr:type I-MYXAN CRISPR-associated Cas8a1/Cmx1 [Leptolyngbya sp. FACHB-671]MBD2069541.1 type I-MYXAN CRISPR-associated Cas8a1/Cmx1 [Leptolyngbya sp. FACHB-671]
MESHSSPSLTSSVQSKIQLALSDRYMTQLHCAGMAGLWMTLSQLKKQFPDANQRPGQLDWQLSSCSINLWWSGRDLDILDWLLKQAFQVNEQGLIALTGMDIQTLDVHTQIATHQGIVGTFLQHHKFRTTVDKKLLFLLLNYWYKWYFAAQSNEAKEVRGLEHWHLSLVYYLLFIKFSMDFYLFLEVGEKTIVISYSKLISYAHRDFARRLCNKQGQLLQEPIQIAGLLYPGAVMNHAAFEKQTKFEVASNEALVLLFAPVACWYFMVPSSPRNKRIQYILVIPEISDLEAYAKHGREIRNSSYENFWVSSLGDAGLKFLTLQDDVQPIKEGEVRGCQSVLFTKPTWSRQQLVRKEVERIEATKESLFCYRLCYKYIPQNTIFWQEGKFHIRVSNIRGLIADNLGRGLAWWDGISKETNSQCLFEELSFTEEGLLTMIEEAEWKDQAKKLFVKACHEALRRTYAKLYDQTAEGDYAQIERCNIHIRSELMRCKNATAFREFLSQFFSKAGQIPILQKHWEELLPITTGEVDWKLTRDLTLLALASYSKSEVLKDDKQPEIEELQNSHVGEGNVG